MSDRMLRTAVEKPGSVGDLYVRYAAWLRRRLHGRFGADAEDIGQDAWLRVAALDKVEEVRHPKAYLLRVAINIALMQKRHGDVVANHAAKTSSVDHEDADQLDVLAIKQMILGLPQPLRDVFLLSRVTGLSNDQIAEQLGISRKTVEWRMTRALAHCAKQLRP